MPLGVLAVSDDSDRAFLASNIMCLSHRVHASITATPFGIRHVVLLFGATCGGYSIVNATTTNDRRSCTHAVKEWRRAGTHTATFLLLSSACAAACHPAARHVPHPAHHSLITPLRHHNLLVFLALFLPSLHYSSSSRSAPGGHQQGTANEFFLFSKLSLSLSPRHSSPCTSSCSARHQSFRANIYHFQHSLSAANARLTSSTRALSFFNLTCPFITPILVARRLPPQICQHSLITAIAPCANTHIPHISITTPRGEYTPFPLSCPQRFKKKSIPSSSLQRSPVCTIRPMRFSLLQPIRHAVLTAAGYFMAATRYLRFCRSFCLRVVQAV